MPGSSIINADFRPGRRAFTLVEMLAVMGIIALLLAATLPALRGLNQSENRRGAIGNLMAVLDRARMMAITDGTCTYVVFACPTSGGAQVSPSLWGRGYAIFEDSDNINFKVVQRTAWLYLPSGMAFKKDANIPSITNYPPGTSDPTFPVGSSYLTNSSAAATGVQLPYWKFDSTGVVMDPPVTMDSTLYRRLLLFPGYIDPNGNEISTQNQSGPGNTATAQLEEIDVNPTTGRAKYIIDPANNLSTPSSTPSPSP